MYGRRHFLKTAAGTALATAVVPLIARAADAATSAVEAAVNAAALEAASGGRLGICLVRPGHRQVMAHRAREAFPTASTIKFALSAAVLAKSDAGALSLDDRIQVREQDIRSGAPVSGRRRRDPLGDRAAEGDRRSVLGHDPSLRRGPRGADRTSDRRL